MLTTREDVWEDSVRVLLNVAEDFWDYYGSWLEENKVDLFGLEVNPGLISAIAVTLILLVFALVVRIFVAFDHYMSVEPSARICTFFYCYNAAAYAAVNVCAYKAVSFCYQLTAFYRIAYCDDGHSGFADMLLYGDRNYFRRVKLAYRAVFAYEFHVAEMYAAAEKLAVSCFHSYLRGFICTLCIVFALKERSRFGL